MLELIIDGKVYSAQLFDSATKDDILGMLPLELTMKRYASHEFNAELPYKPAMDSKTTSEILAGHIYYWDGWNSFVINYEDGNISPYKVVDIGEIADRTVVEHLRSCAEKIKVVVKNK